jgi:hypothetical protein
MSSFAEDDDEEEGTNPFFRESDTEVRALSLLTLHSSAIDVLSVFSAFVWAPAELVDRNLLDCSFRSSRTDPSSCC